ncbi:hypothetical protein, partial [Serratia marcescens]|uniref:hypothetical protein n=1 Tax=Serratia marcescens TaxID=615 RepID=UPI003204785F
TDRSKCQIAMRLLGRSWQESLIGAYEKPPAMPEDIYFMGEIHRTTETSEPSQFTCAPATRCVTSLRG